MIGVFDSGRGGISILDGLTKQLPHLSYIYLADTANGSYGGKSAEDVYQCTKQGVEQLFELDCTIVILACNTASAVALRKLQQEWLPTHYPNRRILGILVPTIEEITENNKINSLAILATPATIKSGAYEREIKKRFPKMQLMQQPCPGLADLIERNAPDEDIQKKAHLFIQTLLRKNNQHPEALLLGCTHYSLKHELFASLVPSDTLLFDQPTVVASSFASYLQKHPEITAQLITKGTITYLSTSGQRAHQTSP